MKIILEIYNEYKKGQPGEYGCETVRDGKHLAVKFTPLVINGKISACVQTVVLK